MLRRAKHFSAPVSSGHGDLKSTANKRKSSLQSRSSLDQEYKTLFNITLPAAAKSQGWPIWLNHCLMRVALDGYWKCCWYDKLDRKKGALNSMSAAQIEGVVQFGNKMMCEGKLYVEKLNTQSLIYRGKKGPKQTRRGGTANSK